MEGSSEIDEIDNDLADKLINILESIDQEYDTLLNDAEKVYGSLHKEMRVNESEGEVDFEFALLHHVSVADDVKRRWEERELSLKLFELEKEKEKVKDKIKIYAERKTLLERRYKCMKAKYEYLNEQVKKHLGVLEDIKTEDVQKIQQKLEDVKYELDVLGTTERIYPNEMIGTFNACQETKMIIAQLHQKLEQYADLPPDFDKAKDKLREARLKAIELEKLIRNKIL